MQQRNFLTNYRPIMHRKRTIPTFPYTKDKIKISQNAIFTTILLNISKLQRTNELLKLE